VGWEKVAYWSTKAAISLKRIKTEEKLLRRAYRKSQIENDRFMIYDRCPMSDVAMAISTDADTDADAAYLDHLMTS